MVAALARTNTTTLLVVNGWEATAELWVRSHDGATPPFCGRMEGALELCSALHIGRIVPEAHFFFSARTGE